MAMCDHTYTVIGILDFVLSSAGNLTWERANQMEVGNPA